MNIIEDPLIDCGLWIQSDAQSKLCHLGQRVGTYHYIEPCARDLLRVSIWLSLWPSDTFQS